VILLIRLIIFMEPTTDFQLIFVVEVPVIWIVDFGLKLGNMLEFAVLINACPDQDLHGFTPGDQKREHHPSYWSPHLLRRDSAR
jgi:hypothetical protein